MRESATTARTTTAQTRNRGSHRAERDAATADRSAAARTAASRGAGRDQRASARRQMAGLPNGRVHALSVQPRTGAGGRLCTAAHHRHPAAAGRDHHRRGDGRQRALDGDAGRFGRSAQRRAASGGEATGSGHRDQPDHLHDQAHLPPAAALARARDAGGRVLLSRRTADGDERCRHAAASAQAGSGRSTG